MPLKSISTYEAQAVLQKQPMSVQSIPVFVQIQPMSAQSIPIFAQKQPLSVSVVPVVKKATNASSFDFDISTLMMFLQCSKSKSKYCVDLRL